MVSITNANKYSEFSFIYAMDRAEVSYFNELVIQLSGLRHDYSDIPLFELLPVDEHQFRLTEVQIEVSNAIMRILRMNKPPKGCRGIVEHLKDVMIVLDGKLKFEDVNLRYYEIHFTSIPGSFIIAKIDDDYIRSRFN